MPLGAEFAAATDMRDYKHAALCEPADPGSGQVARRERNREAAVASQQTRTCAFCLPRLLGGFKQRTRTDHRVRHARAVSGARMVPLHRVRRGVELGRPAVEQFPFGQIVLREIGEPVLGRQQVIVDVDKHLIVERRLDRRDVDLRARAGRKLTRRPVPFATLRLLRLPKHRLTLHIVEIRDDQMVARVGPIACRGLRVRCEERDEPALAGQKLALPDRQQCAARIERVPA